MSGIGSASRARSAQVDGAPAGTAAAESTPRPPHRHPVFRLVLAAGLALAVTAGWWWPPVETAFYALEAALTDLLPAGTVESAAWFLLPLIGLAGGLLASVSPCILPLVPLNAAYIGARGVPPRQAAAVSARFVLGAVVALSVLGLFADLAGAVFIEYRGPVRMAVGTILLVLGAMQAELLPMPRLPAVGGGRRLGAVAAGAAFALITTPCASPILFGVLTAAGSQSVPGLSVATMGSFAVGYTALVFAAGVAGGRATERFRRASRGVQATGAAVLVVAGVGFLLSGLAWLG